LKLLKATTPVQTTDNLMSRCRSILCDFPCMYIAYMLCYIRRTVCCVLLLRTNMNTRHKVPVLLFHPARFWMPINSPLRWSCLVLRSYGSTRVAMALHVHARAFFFSPLSPYLRVVFDCYWGDWNDS